MVWDTHSAGDESGEVRSDTIECSRGVTFEPCARFFVLIEDIVGQDFLENNVVGVSVFPVACVVGI